MQENISQNGGAYGVYLHAYDQSPYYTGNRRYYKKNVTSPVINGFNVICSGSPKPFSVTSNWKSCYSWDKSSNLSLSSTTTNPTTVSAATTSSTGKGWISIKNNNGTELVRYDVWVGKPNSSDFDVAILKKTMTQYACDVFADNYSYIDLFDWYIPYSGWTITERKPNMIAPMDRVNITAPSSIAETALYILAHNTCGWCSDIYLGMLGPNWGYTPIPALTYPNPVSDILNIEIDEVAILQEKDNQQTDARADITNEIRLYDEQGNVLRQAKTKFGIVQFNVSSLPNGIYYLHVFYGVNTPPSMQQIVVEH